MIVMADNWSRERKRDRDHNVARSRARAARRSGRPCTHCARPLNALRSSKRFCSDLCRKRAWRGHAPVVCAHQRRVHEDLRTMEPKAVASSLDGYSVALIRREAALPLIRRYEWLGNIGRATIFVGLLSPVRDLQGVACFGPGPGGPIQQHRIGGPALCLERGACVHYAPKNAASFLISRAVKLVHRSFGVGRFFAYCDPEAGEYGGVYQAAGWVYLGQGLKGKDGQRRFREAVLQAGRDPEAPANWQSDQALRRGGRRLTLRQARRCGWVIVRRAAKHVYAVCVGRERRRWCRDMPSAPYPKPHPEARLLRTRLDAAARMGPTPDPG